MKVIPLLLIEEYYNKNETQSFGSVIEMLDMNDKSSMLIKMDEQLSHPREKVLIRDVKII